MTLPKDFNYLSYIKINTDLEIINEEDAKTHYLNCGIFENRQYKIILPLDFDVEAYLFLNPDLFFVTDEEAKTHYIECGIFENRQYKIILPLDFDVKAYLFLNPYLFFVTDEEAKTHYIKSGIFENKQYKIILPLDFDVKAYLFLNPDISLVTDEEVKNHYIECGIFEGRKYNNNNNNNMLPYNFNVKSYLFLNPDLSGLTDEQAKYHYINHGIFEKRNYNIILPKDFKVYNYLYLNPDLEKLNRRELIKHYLQFGVFEKRPYKTDLSINLPPEFNFENYIAVNPDLIGMNEHQAKNHYILTGMNENRNITCTYIPDEFDWKYYISNNSNLNSFGINTKEDAEKYYITRGFKEKEKKYKDPVFSFFRENNLFDDKNLFNILIKLLCNVEINDISYDVYKDNFSHFISGKPIFNLNNSNSILNYNDLDSHIENKFKDEIKLFTKLNSVILIIDFPESFVGGAAFFINSIIAKYKTQQTFLVLRKYNNNSFKFTINDEKIYYKNYSESSAMDILLKIKNIIKKIFINHAIEFSETFIDKLTSLGKEITTITHDYYWICHKPQPFYHELPKKEDMQYNKWKNIDKIIIQNPVNINIFGNFSEKNKFIITDLPDFNKSDKRIDTDNKKIVVGIIGSISDIKGKSLIQLFIKSCQNNDNIEFVVFGECNVNLFNNKNNIYKNIYELNDLLIKYKPNILLETSLWPETYSYTLTLAMLTQLPICSMQKKFKGVIESRLSKYDKYIPFSSVNEAIRYIKIAKQDYFYTIEPTLYYNHFWDSYFSENSTEPMKFNENNSLIFLEKNVNVVFISSKIYVSNVSYSYAATRSIYTATQRLEQTVKTISSVRKYIPNSYIVLFDNSKFEIEELNNLNNMVDLFINLCDNEELNEYTNNKSSKIYGELAQFFYFLEYWEKNMKELPIKQFFKISGRYLVNETFNYHTYDNDFNIFKRNSSVEDRKYFYTSFFKISGNKFYVFSKIMRELFEESKTHLNYDNKDFEVVIPEKLNYDFIEIDKLGITQNISVWNQQDKI
jgi:hypothetical protein